MLHALILPTPQRRLTDLRITLLLRRYTPPPQNSNCHKRKSGLLPARKAAYSNSTMELRKDPITRSWVITGDDQDSDRGSDFLCPFCPESGQQLHVLTSMPTVNGNPWSARAVVHPKPLYRVEGDPGRAGNGLYDTMQPVGAHEVIIENARH